ncbi:MAG: hypothetical protein WA477_21780 [Candidatus Sulfotelmatobacter sp.]
MKHTLVYKIVALAVAGVSLSATSALAQKGADAFNRASLSTTWVVTAGSLSISNKQLVGATGSLGYLKSLTANSATAASAVVFIGSTDLEYGAVALGNIAGGSDAFVKIQSQNGVGTFDHGAFYTGNNGSGTFFALSSPVPSPAILDVFFCGTTAHMRITSAAGVQSYTSNYGTTFGVGGGLGTYGSISLDNFDGFASGCNDADEHAIPSADMPHDIDLTLAK